MKLLYRFSLLVLILNYSQLRGQYIIQNSTYGELVSVEIGDDITEDEKKQGFWTTYYTPWSPEHKEAFDEQKAKENANIEFYIPDANDSYKKPEYSEAIKQEFIDNEDYLNQHKKFEGFYEDGKKLGYCKWYNIDGKITDLGRYYLDEQTYYANYKDGKVDMALYTLDDETYTHKKEFYYSNGKLQEVFFYKGDYKYGPFKRYYDTGELYLSTTFKNSKFNGPYTYYYTSGAIKEEGEFLNGERNGEVIEYFKNGNILEKQTYVNGKVDGILEMYHKNGNLETRQRWENGRVIAIMDHFLEDGTQTLKNGNGDMILYYDNSNLDFEAPYKNGIRDGVTTWYYKNGQLKQKALYKYDEAVGQTGLRWEIMESYTKDGTPREKGTLKNGNGTWISYKGDGNKSVTTFKNGKKVE